MIINSVLIVNSVRKYDDERVGIFVSTGKDPNGAWYIEDIDGTNFSSNDYIGEIGSGSANGIDQMIDTSANEYVNPNGRFIGKVIRNENDSIIGLAFEQQ